MLRTEGAEVWQKGWTPLFDFERYWKGLDEERRRVGVKTSWARESERWDGSKRLGDVVLYGEAVTSTQTMLDK